jgi:ATP-dependent DNA ligase
VSAAAAANDGDGALIYQHACALGCEGIVSKRLGSPYRAGRTDQWLKMKNPAAPAVPRHDRKHAVLSANSVLDLPCARIRGLKGVLI